MLKLSPRTLVVAGLLAAAALSAFAQVASPVGLWKTIDDDTKKVKSYVRITDTGGVYTGTVEKLLDPDTPPDAACVKCSDDRKDKPILGMTIIRDVRQNGDDKGVFDGGHILDPNNGKVYRVKLKPIDGGAKLEVRGFIGFSLLGRTQTWIRVE